MKKYKYKIESALEISDIIEELCNTSNINSITLNYWKEAFKPEITTSNLEEIKSKIISIITSNPITLDLIINNTIKIHYSEVEDPTITSDTELNLKNTILEKK